MVNAGKIGIVIQARMNSSRLPGKILLPLPNPGPMSLLGQIVKRASMVQNISDIVIATSTNIENDHIEKAFENLHVKIFRGDEDDVLKRFYEVAKLYDFSIIVRLTADNPFIEASIIEKAIDFHVKNQNDYTLTEGLPLGTNIEVFNFSALEQSHMHADLLREREHVTPYMRFHPEYFKLGALEFDSKLKEMGARMTVDNENDYAFACLVYELLGKDDEHFNSQNVEDLILEKAWILFINKENVQKKVFASSGEEIGEAIRVLSKLDLNFSVDVLKKELKKFE